MGRVAKVLTPLEIKKITDTGKPGMHAAGNGLYIQIKATKNGQSLSWVFRYTFHGKRRDMGLGSLGRVTIAQARKLLLQAQAQLSEGVDPVEARQAQRAANTRDRMTFERCAGLCIEAIAAEWKNAKTRRQWERQLRAFAYPVIGTLSVAAVNREHMLKILNPIWLGKTVTAVSVRRRVASVLDYAIANEWREDTNPAKWENLKNVLAAPDKIHKPEHFPSLGHKELPGFIVALSRMDTIIAAVALYFTILTCVRTSETRLATWDEFDFEEALWTIPAERMKRDRPHAVPLSEPVIRLIDSLPRISKYLFPGRDPEKPLSNMAMLKVLSRMGRDDLTVHGFRSTFKEWARRPPQSRYPDEYSELVLAHVNSDATRAAYARDPLADERRPLMDDWAKFCAEGKIIDGGKVVAIGKNSP